MFLFRADPQLSFARSKTRWMNGRPTNDAGVGHADEQGAVPVGVVDGDVHGALLERGAVSGVYVPIAVTRGISLSGLCWRGAFAVQTR